MDQSQNWCELDIIEMLDRTQTLNIFETKSNKWNLEFGCWSFVLIDAI